MEEVLVILALAAAGVIGYLWYDRVEKPKKQRAAEMARLRRDWARRAQSIIEDMDLYKPLRDDQVQFLGQCFGTDHSHYKRAVAMLREQIQSGRTTGTGR